MTSPSLSSTPSRFATFTGLAPVVTAVFLGFLAVSLPLAALALQVRDHLGLGPLTVGLTIAAQSLATLLSRHQSGALCDRRGPRLAVVLGLPIAAASGLFYLASTALPLVPLAQLGLILAGRVLMGIGESLFLTGLMSIGIARLGPAHTGKVMSWTGIAIYAALGLGAPIGLAVHSAFGFASVGLAVGVAPLAAWLVARGLPDVPASGESRRVPFHRVLGLIWRPGLVLALATLPYAAMAAFLALHYRAHGWAHAGLALSGFGAAYVLVRLFGSGLADRHGAARVAIGSLAFEAAGQIVLWLAPTAWVALLGATLTGLGFSLVFPAMGVLATRSVPPEQRGRAVGNFMAFADIALAATGPLVGAATLVFGVSATFAVGAAAALTALCLLPLIRSGSPA